MLYYTGPDQRWADALERALDANIRIWQHVSALRDYYVFETTSSEENALPIYTVAVKADMYGIHVSCDCQAGMHYQPCMHSAKVLNEMGHLPSETPEPTPLRRPVLGGRELSGQECLAILNGMDS